VAAVDSLNGASLGWPNAGRLALARRPMVEGGFLRARTFNLSAFAPDERKRCAYRCGRPDRKSSMSCTGLRPGRPRRRGSIPAIQDVRSGPSGGYQAETGRPACWHGQLGPPRLTGSYGKRATGKRCKRAQLAVDEHWPRAYTCPQPQSSARSAAWPPRQNAERPGHRDLRTNSAVAASSLAEQCDSQEPSCTTCTTPCLGPGHGKSSWLADPRCSGLRGFPGR